MMQSSVVGVDGCKAGWFAIERGNNGSLRFGIYSKFEDLWVAHRSADLIFVDMPLGLPFRKTDRQCDKDARKLLGKRSSSVFPSPCREAMNAKSYEEASTINFKQLGKKLSKQVWFIIPKIKDLDKFLLHNKIARQNIWESHPEINFKLLKGSDLQYSKKVPEGIKERLEILDRYWIHSSSEYMEILSKHLKKDVSPDDILDAMVLAISAEICLNTSSFEIPKDCELDAEGLRMQMRFPKLM